MEQPLTTQPPESTINNTATFPILENIAQIPPMHLKRNIYPSARHILLIITVLFTICIILFLIHQNGKSIYDNGL